MSCSRSEAACKRELEGQSAFRQHRERVCAGIASVGDDGTLLLKGLRASRESSFKSRVGFKILK